MTAGRVGVALAALVVVLATPGAATATLAPPASGGSPAAAAVTASAAGGVATAAPSPTCAGTGGGVAYVTDTGLTVYENDSSIAFGSFPDDRTVDFGEVALEAGGTAEARLESGTGDVTCLGDVDATQNRVVVRPDGENDLTVTGSLNSLSFGDAVYTRGDGGTDLAYDASGSWTVTLADTDLTEGMLVRAKDASGNVLGEGTVATDGSVSLALPSGTEAADLVRRPKPQFLGSTGPFSVSEAAPAGAEVGDLDASSGDGGAVDTSVSYAIVGGNPDRDGDGTPAFGIDATGTITVADSADVDASASDRELLTVEADDGVRTATTNVGVEVSDTTPTIESFDLATTDDGSALQVTIDSDQQLASIDASVAGPDGETVASLDGADFQADGNTYRATVTVSEDGEYEATLRRAADEAGNDGADGQTDTATVEDTGNDTEAPTVQRFEATTTPQGNLNVSLVVDEPLAAINVSLVGGDGTGLGTLDGSAFAGSELGDGDYRYLATPSVEYNGTVRLTLETALDSSGNDAASGQTATVVLGGNVTVERTVAGTVPPNGSANATVTVELGTDVARLGITENVTPAAEEVSLQAVEVNGSPQFPTAQGASDSGMTVALEDLDAGATVTVTYRVTPDANATSHVLSGKVVTGSETVEMANDTVRVAAGGPVERADLNDDGDISTDELSTAVSDWTTGVYSTDDLQLILQAWANDG